MESEELKKHQVIHVWKSWDFSFSVVKRSEAFQALYFESNFGSMIEAWKRKYKQSKRIGFLLLENIFLCALNSPILQCNYYNFMILWLSCNIWTWQATLQHYWGKTSRNPLSSAPKLWFSGVILAYCMVAAWNHCACQQPIVNCHI